MERIRDRRQSEISHRRTKKIHYKSSYTTMEYKNTGENFCWRGSPYVAFDELPNQPRLFELAALLHQRRGTQLLRICPK